MTHVLLKQQDDKTSSLTCRLLDGNADFKTLSESEGALIVRRDAEDEAKLKVGIDIAVNKGVLPKESPAGPTTRIDVVGKTADAVAAELLSGCGDKREGLVIVLTGLSGTGKGTTVKKLTSQLEKCQIWSNGNVFRSITHLVQQDCKKANTPFDGSVLTAEKLAATIKRLKFEQIATMNNEYHLTIDGEPICHIENTALKTPEVSKSVPLVAEQTQGEVVTFAAGAVAILQAAGFNIILEGRAQTLNYIPTPHRFELAIDDLKLLGQRRAAQLVMAQALQDATAASSTAAADDADCGSFITGAAQKLAQARASL